ncbi:MFS transporter [Micromonospora sp. NPDC002389]|uniref:MFS transporter n=1 Tax=Micromonospora sp. NPDC002389 TaxID=3154272 RepID=UPI00332158CD
MTSTETDRPRERRRWAIDLRPLRVVAYRRLWLGNGIAMFGFQFTAVAVPVEMYALTQDSLWVGLLGIAAFVPLLVFGLWGGAVADAIDRRLVLTAGSVLLWVSVVGLLAQALLGVGSPVLLLGLVALSSVAYAISGPARSALVARLVPAELVPAATTLNFTTAMATSVLGPLAAGLILAAWHLDVALPIAYAVDAVLLVALVWAALRLPAMPPEPDPDGTPRQAGLRSVVDGFRYLLASRVLMLSFAIDLIAMVFAFPRALFPEVAAERFGGGAAVGWLYSSIAIGSLLAGLVSGWIGRVRRQGLVLVLAVVGWGLAVALAGLARQLWLVIALLVLAGAADLISSVVRQSILLIYAPDRMRGRLQGVNTVVVAGGPRLGDLRAGAMATGFGSGVAWVGGGLVAAGLAVVLAVAFPALRRYRPPVTSTAEGAYEDHPARRADSGSGG